MMKEFLFLGKLSF